MSLSSLIQTFCYQNNKKKPKKVYIFDEKYTGQDKILVELWDISGGPKYDRCWPVILKDCHGCILTYNADNSLHIFK